MITSQKVRLFFIAITAGLLAGTVRCESWAGDSFAVTRCLWDWLRTAYGRGSVWARNRHTATTVRRIHLLCLLPLRFAKSRLRPLCGFGAMHKFLADLETVKTAKQCKQGSAVSKEKA